MPNFLANSINCYLLQTPKFLEQSKFSREELVKILQSFITNPDTSLIIFIPKASFEYEKPLIDGHILRTFSPFEFYCEPYSVPISKVDENIQYLSTVTFYCAGDEAIVKEMQEQFNKTISESVASNNQGIE